MSLIESSNSSTSRSINPSISGDSKAQGSIPSSSGRAYTKASEALRGVDGKLSAAAEVLNSAANINNPTPLELKNQRITHLKKLMTDYLCEGGLPLTIDAVRQLKEVKDLLMGKNPNLAQASSDQIDLMTEEEFEQIGEELGNSFSEEALATLDYYYPLLKGDFMGSVSPLLKALDNCPIPEIKSAWIKAIDSDLGVVRFGELNSRQKNYSGIKDAAILHNVRVIQNEPVNSRALQEAEKALSEVLEKVAKFKNDKISFESATHSFDLISRRFSLSLTCSDEPENSETKIARNNYIEAEKFISKLAKGARPIIINDLKTVNRLINEKMYANGNNSGEFRTLDSGIVIDDVNVEYINEDYIDEEMSVFIDWLNAGIEECQNRDSLNSSEKGNICHGNPLILAALAYSRLVSIHPFADGNGRTSRLIMNFVCEKLDLPCPTPPYDDENYLIADKGFFAAVYGQYDEVPSSLISQATLNSSQKSDLIDYVTYSVINTLNLIESQHQTN